MSNPINYISLAKKAGFIETGEENTGNAVRDGKAKLLVLAADASDNAVRRANGYVQGRKTPLVRVPFTKQELAAATGRHGCSMLVFKDIGLANGFVAALAEQYPEQYSALSRELESKKIRMAQRKKPAAGAGKNKKTGKRRTIE